MYTNYSNLPLILHFFEIWWIICPILAFARGCLSLMHSLGVNPYIWDGEIWPQETVNIPLSYSAECILMS